jgi:hypothetical protein
VTTPHASRGWGFWNDAGVSSHTIRSGRRTEASSRSKQLLYHMAHKTLARYCFYRRERFTDERPNSIQLFVYKRTTSLFFLCKKKAEVLFTFCLLAARLSSPGVNTGAFRRDLVRLSNAERKRSWGEISCSALQN